MRRFPRSFGKRVQTSFFLPIFLLITACNQSADSGDAGISENQDGDAVGNEGFTVEIEVSEEIGTVARVTWSLISGGANGGEVHFGLTEQYGQVASSEATDQDNFESIILGIKPSSTYHLNIVATTNAGEISSQDYTFETGPVPTALPEFNVTVSDDRSQMGQRGFLVTSVFAVPPAAVIIDGQGDYVWWHLEEDPDFMISRAHLSPDLQWVYYWSTNLQAGGGPGGPGGLDQPPQRLTRVSIDGTIVEEFPLEDGHHDFTILPDGTITYIEYDTRTIDGEEIQGDRLIEFNVDEGTSTEIFNVWDYVEYSPGSLDRGNSWSHGNYIEYDEIENVYFMSLISPLISGRLAQLSFQQDSHRS